jgi:hypothetical protein
MPHGGFNSIRRRGGLRPHLDGQTNLGYAFFVDALKKGVNIQDLARLYDRNRLTIKKWVGIYTEEQQASKKRKRSSQP